MHRRLTLLLALACGLPAGCGREEPERLPGACRVDGDAVVAALRSAPARVELDGVPLSGCLTQDSSAGDLQQVGAAFLGAAARLAPNARAREEGRAALRLGYLVGAVRRGAGASQGIHSELVRRLDQELAGVDTRARAFRRGRRAGRRSG